jgi:hypothetical protein
MPTMSIGTFLFLLEYTGIGTYIVKGSQLKHEAPRFLYFCRQSNSYTATLTRSIQQESGRSPINSKEKHT